MLFLLWYILHIPRTLCSGFPTTDRDAGCVGCGFPSQARPEQKAGTYG